MEAVWAALEVSPAAMAIGVAVTFLGGLIHGTLGFGLGMVSVPTLALVSPLLAPSPQVVLSLPLALMMAAREWRAADLRGAALLSVGGVVGTVAGALVLKVAAQATMDALIGAAVLVAVGLLARGRAIKRTRATLVGAGTATGFMGLVSAIGGPPMALVYRDAPGATLRATLAVVFGFGSVITVGGRAWAGALGVGDIWRAAVMTLGLALGIWASKFLITRVEGAPLRIGVLVFAALAGASLVVRALL